MAKSILDALVTKTILTLIEAGDIRKEAKEKKIPVDDVLYKHGISETDVAEAKSELTGYPTKYLHGGQVSFEILRDIPEESARYYGIVPLGKNEGMLEIGILHPDNMEALEALKFISSRINMPVRVFIIIPSDFDGIIQQYKSLSGEVTSALGVFEKKKEIDVQFEIQKESQPKLTEEAPITKIFSVILRHAVEGRASDVHIEPAHDVLRVRFRVDGLLYTSLTVPKEVHLGLISRIKVMTNLKIDETRIPQDGRFHAEIMDRPIDFRVSTFPTVFGEKVVIRILDPAGAIQNLESVGLQGAMLNLIQEKLNRPYGLILITGPTGSGKSTTLYAMLQLINKEGINIVSLEDPVEYYIPGVNQSQVRPEINYDFASGLRHVVRQDPDIIMVGEIRDKETAQLAIHAALTGHLVLSTLHTNNAAGVIPRLIDMGVDPFLLAPTLILAIAQRLVRKLCNDSRKTVLFKEEIKEAILKEIGSMPEILKQETLKSLPKEIYKSEVSPICPKGTRGRIGIFEVLSMTPELEQIILTGASEIRLEEEAKRQHMITMRQDGILKVLQGTIAFEELLEVV